MQPPETTPNAAVETRKVEIPEDDTTAEGESVLKKPIITPAEEPATDDKNKTGEEVRDANQPIPDPAAEAVKPAVKPAVKTVAPELVNPLDRTVHITIPRMTSVFVGTTVSTTPVRSATVILDDEGWIPLK